jgi:hypothetical protein
MLQGIVRLVICSYQPLQVHLSLPASVKALRHVCKKLAAVLDAVLWERVTWDMDDLVENQVEVYERLAAVARVAGGIRHFCISSHEQAEDLLFHCLYFLGPVMHGVQRMKIACSQPLHLPALVSVLSTAGYRDVAFLLDFYPPCYIQDNFSSPPIYPAVSISGLFEELPNLERATFWGPLDFTDEEHLEKHDRLVVTQHNRTRTRSKDQEVQA